MTVVTGWVKISKSWFACWTESVLLAHRHIYSSLRDPQNEGVFNTFGVWNKRSSIFSKNADHHFMRCFKFSRAHNFQPMAFPREMGHFCTAGHSKRIRFKENCRLSEFHSHKIISANSIQAFLPLILISLKIFFCILANEKSLSWKSSLSPWETVIER